MNMTAISVLLVDADTLIRECLRNAVEGDSDMEVCWEADDGLKALLLAQQHGPQLVLMDALLPRMDGIEATRILRQRRPEIRIILMGVYEQARAQAIAAGADEFVTKDCGCEAIRDAIRRLVSNV